MAFVIENDQVVSFAEFQDVLEVDQRIFTANEGLSDDFVNSALERATQRILIKIRATGWWKSYYINRDASIPYQSIADIPGPDPEKIVDRQQDFTDMCVFIALADQILPSVADFGDPDSTERQKMSYYTQRYNQLFTELVQAGDWYDFDGDGSVSSNEKQPGAINLKRIR